MQVLSDCLTVCLYVSGQNSVLLTTSVMVDNPAILSYPRIFISPLVIFSCQLVKGPGMQRQDFYPTPPTSVLPNATDRSPQLTVSPRTANALYNLQRSYWQTHYYQQYTGNGPQNVLKLDNFEDVCRGRGEELVGTAGYS